MGGRACWLAPTGQFVPCPYGRLRLGGAWVRGDFLLDLYFDGWKGLLAGANWDGHDHPLREALPWVGAIGFALDHAG